MSKVKHRSCNNSCPAFARMNDPQNKAFQVYRVATEAETMKSEDSKETVQYQDHMDVDIPEAGPSGSSVTQNPFPPSLSGDSSTTSASDLFSNIQEFSPGTKGPKRYRILFVPDPTRRGKPHSVNTDLAWLTISILESEYDTIKGLNGWVFLQSRNKQSGMVNVKIQEWVSPYKL
jgi:hypothetical protein